MKASFVFNHICEHQKTLTKQTFIIFIHKYHYFMNIKPLKLLLSYTKKLPAISRTDPQKKRKKILKINFGYCILVL